MSSNTIKLQRNRFYAVLLAIGCSAVGFTEIPEHVVLFDTSKPGENKCIPTWGLEVTWPSYENTVRTLEFMGADEVDFVRVAFVADKPLMDGQLSTEKREEMDRMAELALIAGKDKPWTLMPGTESGVDAYFKRGTEIDTARWVNLMELAANYYQHPFFFAEPFNEPDYGWGQGTKENLAEICRLLKESPVFSKVSLAGASTLNCDQAISWHYEIQDYVDFGTTHTLAGSCSNYIAFLKNLASKGVVAMNPEAHNIVEPMIGAEYGMQVSMWWGVAEWTRANFVKACQGTRLGYAENQRNWTAASVYKTSDGAVKGFVGASERMATATTYKFVSKSKDVYFDGHGPQREYVVTIPGGTGYWQNQPNAEQVIDITWGEDVSPAINGQYQMVNRATGRVMEVAEAGLYDGANIMQNLPGQGVHQHWDIVPLDPRHGGDFSYYSILSTLTGKAADVYDWNLQAGADVRQWEYYGNSNQAWILEYVEDGYFRIRSRWSGKYLEVSSVETESMLSASNVQLGDADGGLSQQWRLIPVDAAVEFEAPVAPVGLSAAVYQVSVTLNWTANLEPDLAGYHIYRSTDPEAPFELIARNVPLTSYTDPAANQRIAYYYKIAAVDHSLNRSAFSEVIEATPNGANALVAAYGFEQSTDDQSGNGNHALMVGEVTFEAGVVGESAAVLDGVESWIQLPATVLNHPLLSLSCWVNWQGGSDGQRIFDFGTGPNSSLYLTPKAAETGLQLVIQQGEVATVLNAPALVAEQWTVVEVVFDETTVSLYIGGMLADAAPIVIRPSDLQPVLNYIGRGQEASIPFFNGSIDDLRIHNFPIK